MKIGMILDNEFTGDPRVENEVQALQQAGHSVVVLCLNFGEKPSIEKKYGATIVRLKVKRKWYKKMKGLNNTLFNIFPYWWKKKIITACIEYKIEQLYIHDLWMLEAGLKANAKLQLPLTVDLHENFVFALGHYRYSTTFPGSWLISQKKWKKDEIKWLQKVDNIIVVIEEAKERLIKLGFDADRITVIPNYVNLEAYKIEKSPLLAELNEKYKDKQLLVYTGGFDRHRGLDIAIRGMSALVKRINNVHLLLVGGGSNEKELKDLVHKLQLEAYVTFAGYRPHQELPAFVQAAKMGIIPHLKTKHTDNTIPHKLFQYMYLKKPVIASNCRPIERIVKETNAGFIYEFDDPDAFAVTVEEALDNDLEAIGDYGYHAVIHKYNWEKASQGLINLFSK